MLSAVPAALSRALIILLTCHGVSQFSFWVRSRAEIDRRNCITVEVEQHSKVKHYFSENQSSRVIFHLDSV